MRKSPSHDKFNPFEEDEQEALLVIQAINHIRDILDLPMIAINELPSEDSQPPTSLCHLQTPVFIGHGSADPKVLARHGENILSFLRAQIDLPVEPESSSDHQKVQNTQ